MREFWLATMSHAIVANTDPPDWGHMNPMGGHGTVGSCAAHPMACANESLVHDLKANISLIGKHPAILGY